MPHLKTKKNFETVYSDPPTDNIKKSNTYILMKSQSIKNPTSVDGFSVVPNLPKQCVTNHHHNKQMGAPPPHKLDLAVPQRGQTALMICHNAHSRCSLS